MTYYERKKEELRTEAIQTQHDYINGVISWVELFEVQDYFYTRAKKYGLVRELKENAII